MSNKSRTTSNGQPGKRRQKVVYPDDRSKTVKSIDNICRVLAMVLAIMVLINVHSLIQGGGYEDSTVVPLLGISDSRVENSYMKPEIPDKSIIVARAALSYEEGDIVQYFDGKRNPVSRVIKASEDEITLQGDSQEEAVTVEKKDVVGKVIFHTTFLYGFMGWYHTALGAVSTVILTVILLSFGDILMIKKRKKALDERRAAQAKKEAMKLKKQQNQNAEVMSDLGNIEDKAALKKAKKQEQIEKEKEEVAKEMKELQEKMKKEEEEFNRERKGKK